MYAAQPDLWDFAIRTMYEMTTAGQAGFKSGNTGKLAAQVKLANDITGVAECGGLMFSPGGWALIAISLLPSPERPLYLNCQCGWCFGLHATQRHDERVGAGDAAGAAGCHSREGRGPAAARAVAGAAAKGAGKVASVYAIASLVAGVILVSSGKAEAKAGPGTEEPIVQLFQALAQKGTPVPPEIQQMIQNDPELKAKLDKALEKGGDPTAAQQELNDKIQNYR